MDKEKIIMKSETTRQISIDTLEQVFGKEKAVEVIAIIERQAVKNHYRAIASRTNAKKGFGSNKKLASEMGKRRWMDVKKQVK